MSVNRNTNRVTDLPLVGEIVAQLMLEVGRHGLDATRVPKEDWWGAVHSVCPGYPRAAFDRHWSQLVDKR